jgi:hypothetical protein
LDDELQTGVLLLTALVGCPIGFLAEVETEKLNIIQQQDAVGIFL